MKALQEHDRPLQAGDKVRYKDGDPRIFTVYHVYSKTHVSLSLAGYPDHEQDYQVSIKEIERV